MNATDNSTHVSHHASSCPPVPHEALLTALSFWGEGVLMLVICAVGTAGNCAAVPVLLSKKMASTFNRLLVFLTVYDNVFLVCAAAEAWRRYFGHALGHAFMDAHLLLFVHFLYQAQNVALACSTYTTVVLAVERYLAVTRPLEYHLQMAAASGQSPWRRVWCYMAPTLFLGLVFNLPKFFELRVEEVEPTPEELAHANATGEPIHHDGPSLRMIPTEMRLHEVYVFVYVNLARLLVMGLVPFLSLVFLNNGIHRAIKLRRAGGPGSSNGHGAGGGGSQQQQDSEENRAALVLFFIVASFLICNIPRVVLNTYEVFTVHTMRANVKNRCFSLPFWVVATTILSVVLIALNSSVNFFLYCFVNPTFRTEFLARINACCPRLAAFLSGGSSSPAPGAAAVSATGTSVANRRLTRAVKSGGDDTCPSTSLMTTTLVSADGGKGGAGGGGASTELVGANNGKVAATDV